MSDFTALSDFDQGWVVGILEGEACFVLRKRPSNRRGEYIHAFAIEVVSVDPETPTRLQRLLGGKVYGPYRKSEMKWTLHKRAEVAALLRSIRPYFCARRQLRISELLEAYDQYARPIGASPS